MEMAFSLWVRGMLRALFKQGAPPPSQRKKNPSTTGNSHQSSTRQNSCFQPTSRQQMKEVAPCCSSPPSFHSLAAFVRPFPSVPPPQPSPPLWSPELTPTFSSSLAPPTPPLPQHCPRDKSPTVCGNEERQNLKESGSFECTLISVLYTFFTNAYLLSIILWFKEIKVLEKPAGAGSVR